MGKRVSSMCWLILVALIKYCKNDARSLKIVSWFADSKEKKQGSDIHNFSFFKQLLLIPSQ